MRALSKLALWLDGFALPTKRRWRHRVMRRELRHHGVVASELGAQCIGELVREAEGSAALTTQLWAAGIEPVPEEMRRVRTSAPFVWNARGIAGIVANILKNPDLNKRDDSNLHKILRPHLIARARQS